MTAQLRAGVWIERQRLLELFRFLQVGAVGYVVNVSCFYGLMRCGVPVDIRVFLSFILAASVTWAINRIYTFKT
ncbi:MAG: GtrA family protein, partial [Acidocella sp.]|nr:GtrA family protein [Acidocella sp.]